MQHAKSAVVKCFFSLYFYDKIDNFFTTKNIYKSTVIYVRLLEIMITINCNLPLWGNENID